MKNEENLQDILDRVNKVDAGVNNLIIPILKDTIKDGNKHNTKLFIFTMCELVVIIITVIIAMLLIYRQNNKYHEFLNQFDFTNDSSYVQDIDAGDGSSPTINDGIKVNQ